MDNLKNIDKIGQNPFSDYGYSQGVIFKSIPQQLTDNGLNCEYEIEYGKGIVTESN